jgi:hypothetical protein
MSRWFVRAVPTLAGVLVFALIAGPLYWAIEVYLLPNDLWHLSTAEATRWRDLLILLYFTNALAAFGAAFLAARRLAIPFIMTAVTTCVALLPLLVIAWGALGAIAECSGIDFPFSGMPCN